MNRTLCIQIAYGTVPMSGEAYPNRREHERLAIILEVNYRTEMEFLNTKTKNISAGGMFLRMLYPLPEGIELNVRFSIPEDNINFDVAAEVVWAASYEETNDLEETGMGIRFLNLDKEKGRLLDQYIEGRVKKTRR